MMMDSPFYRNRWGTSPRHPQNPRPVPIATPKTTSSSPSHKPKVVSIPVHFINPNPKISRPDSAILIQKLWRGFRVRKTVKKLLDIQRELLEVEAAILDSNTVEAIRREERERLKVSERLMSLLFKLDSIRGFNVAVRDLRKALIRRAIVLQEKVDRIAASQLEESQCQIQEEKELAEFDHPQLEESQCQIECDHEQQIQDTPPDSENLMEGGEDDKREEEEEGVVVVGKEEEESKRRREDVVERMVEENNRLMRLMADLLDRNEMQTRILSSLSERVGQLEKAFACEKLIRRRAKKQKKSRNAKSLDNHHY